MIRHMTRLKHLKTFSYRSYFYYCCFRFFNIYTFQHRNLTPNEIQLAAKVFGNQLNYSIIRVFNIPYLPWQPVGLFMAPTGHIFVNPENYRQDYSLENLSYQSIFIHELTHIYQHQKHINVLLKGALLQIAYYLSFQHYNPYAYQFIPQKSFWDYNIEQQGDIARDIFLNRIPNIILHPQCNKKI